MSPRLLAVVFQGQETAALMTLPTLVAVTRAEAACVRLAYIRSFPRPRLDRFGRIAVDVDREMARIAHTMVETFTSAARRFDDFTMEVVVRFGRARQEAIIETEVFAPTRIGLFAARDAGIQARWATRSLRRRIARHASVRVVVLETERRLSGWRPWLGTPPRWQVGYSTGATRGGSTR
jgi:hypothetical protein